MPRGDETKERNGTPLLEPRCRLQIHSIPAHHHTATLRGAGRSREGLLKGSLLSFADSRSAKERTNYVFQMSLDQPPFVIHHFSDMDVKKIHDRARRAGVWRNLVRFIKERLYVIFISCVLASSITGACIFLALSLRTEIKQNTDVISTPPPVPATATSQGAAIESLELKMSYQLQISPSTEKEKP